MEEQASLYAQGRDKPGLVVTNAKPGLSFHNYGLATDWAYFPDNNYQPIGVADPMWKEYVDACEKVGVQLISWEKPHNQLKLPVRVQELKAQFDSGGLEAVNTYLERILNGNPTPAA